MAKYIDINDFEGALTNADIEDLPDNVAQEIKNLKIQGGKLEKTFGAGSPADLPTFELALVNSELSKTYAVYNIFTFVSDKFTGNSNDAGDGYRYLLVTVEATAQTVILWWYDPSMPDVTDHLQIENDVVWFETDDDHGFEVGDMVMVQDTKDNASPQASQSSWKTYESVDVVPSTTKLGVNTNSASSWGGSFFETTQVTGSTTQSFGGKHQTHLLVDDNIKVGSIASKVLKLAIAPMNSGGKVLTIAQVDVGGDIKKLGYAYGSGFFTLSETLFNTYVSKTNFTIMSMIGFNNAIYIHYHYQDGSPVAYYNKLVKYTISGTNVTETAVADLGSQSGSIVSPISYMLVENGHLFVLIKSVGLFKVSTGGQVATISTSAFTIGNVRGLTSINQTNNLTAGGDSSESQVNHEYLIVATTNGSTSSNLYSLDILSSETEFTQLGGNLANVDIHGLKKNYFGQNSGKSESIVLWYKNGTDTYLKYSTHNSTSIMIAINTSVNASTFGTGLDIEFIENTTNHPGSASYLMVGTDNISSPASAGNLYGVSTTLSVKTFMNGATGGKSNWNPTCFADCVTGSGFFTHAKGYIGAYGTEAENTSGADSADLYRFTDIGWYNNSWGGSGDCDYRWIDVTNKYDIPTLYHKKDRNPIVPFGDTLRVLPGNIAKVGSNESKGAWIGYIDRSLFNGALVHTANFYAEANRLTNPFTFKNAELNQIDEEIRASDTVKYTVTAIYDGVQETQLEDESIRQIVTNVESADDVSKSEIKLVLNLPTTTMSKRITGLNMYRANKLSGVYETYKLITSYNFVDTGTDTLNVGTTSDAELVMSVEAFADNIIYVKDQDDVLKNMLNDGTVQDITSEIDSITDNNKYDWTTPNYEYAIKVGSFEKQKIEKINAITGYNPTGTTLNEDLTIFDTTITVNNPGNLSTSTVYKLGLRDNTLGTSDGDEDDDAGDYERIEVTAINGNDLTVKRGYPNYQFGGATYSSGSTTITHVASVYLAVGKMITGTGMPDGAIIASITDSTHFELDQPTTASNGGSPQTLTIHSNIKEHSKFDPIKADALTVTGWYRIETDDNMEGRFHNESWRLYKEKIGPGWNTYSATKTEGAFAGKYMGVVIPLPSEDTNGAFTMAPWRDTDGTMKISSLPAQKFTATDDSSPTVDKTFKIEKAYATWDEQLGFTLIETDVSFQAGNWSDPEVIVSTFSDVSAVVSADTNEITILDKGLTSLGEHPYSAESKIKVNAQYVKLCKGRLFLGNIVLDPGNENEAQNDWIAYSELNAYDVRPVSNVLPFPDREGGQITGLAELFGRLVIFKPQAFYVLDVVNPSDPTTWTRKESKINIGNIAPEGIVEVHDSVYFVHHDGIYRLDANTVASSTLTPSVMEKITLPIEDQFLLADSKKAVKGVYDQKNNELLYTWDQSNAQKVWAYHITLKTWRKVDTTTNLDILTFGENSGPLAWDNTDTDIKKFDVAENVGITWKSKRFRMDLDRKQLLRYGMVKFTGTDTVTFNIYLDGSGSVSFTKDITADGGVNRFPIKRYGKSFEMELTTPSSSNTFFLERLRIELE